MSSIGNGASPLSGVNPLYDQRVNDAKIADVKVGVGVNAAAKNVPDPTGGQSTQGTTGARASLSVFMMTGLQVDTEVLLVQVAVSMRDTESTSQKAKINTDQEAKKAQALEKEKKLEESQKKLEEAEAKKNSANIFDKIKLAFEWLGAILAAATAAILIATGVGAAVGVALMAAAVVALVMAIDSTVQMATGMGIAGNISMAVDKMNNANGTNNPPLSEAEMKERAGKADMGFKISMAVLGIALAIASGGASFVNSVKSFGSAVAAGARAGVAAAKTAEEGASLATKIKDVAMAVKGAYKTIMDAADQAADVAATAKDFWKLSEKLGKMAGQSADEIQTTARLAKTYVAAADDITTISNVGAEVGSAGLKYEHTSLSADAKKLAADAKADEAIMMMLDDMIDQALSRLMAASDRFNTMLDDITSSIQDRGDTMSRARFQG